MNSLESLLHEAIPQHSAIQSERQSLSAKRLYGERQSGSVFSRVALAIIVGAVTACGGGGSATVSVIPVNLTSAQIVTELQNNGFNCTPNQITELKGSLAYNNTTQCIIPLQGSLQVAVVDSVNSPLGDLDLVTGVFTAKVGPYSTTASIDAYNLAPQIVNAHGGVFDKVAKVISENQNLTLTGLQVLINNSLTTGTGLRPVINGKFSLLNVLGSQTVNGNKTSLPVVVPAGPNYTLQSSLIPIIDNTGIATGVNAQITLAGGNLSVTGLDAPLVKSGSHTLGSVKLIDNQGSISTYPQGGNMTVTCPAPNVPDGNGGCIPPGI